jgi:hypothetical protein
MAEEETKRGSRTAAQESDEESGRARADEPAGGREDNERPESREADEPAGGRAENGGGDHEEQQVSAPSLGPKTTVEREPVEERLARDEQSEVDAMGLDKRRPVIGQSYGPSKARQFAVYLGFLAVVAALVVGGIILVGNLDKPVGKDVPNSAPWAKHGVKQIKPRPIQ